MKRVKQMYNFIILKLPLSELYSLSSRQKDITHLQNFIKWNATCAFFVLFLVWALSHVNFYRSVTGVSKHFFVTDIANILFSIETHSVSYLLFFVLLCGCFWFYSIFSMQKVFLFLFFSSQAIQNRSWA